MVVLTARERDVLVRIADGKTASQIASELYLSRETVREYVARLYRKLGVHNRVGCVKQAIKRGLV